MWSMYIHKSLEFLEGFLSYLFKSSEKLEFDLDQCYSILSEEAVAVNEETKSILGDADDEDIDTYQSCIHTGTITSQEGNKFIINELHPFTSDSEDFHLGSKVSFALLKNYKNITVNNVSLIENDWNVTETGKISWCKRTLICKVAERKGRVLTLIPDNISVDLNSVSSDFVPYLGDWVEVEVKCEIDETVANLRGKVLQVTSLRPVRLHVKSGKVTFWNSFGTIDKNIYFNKESLSNGYVPIVGDRVIMEIIESEQERNCSWRALKVYPDYLIRRNEANIKDAGLSDINFELTNNKVDITCDTDLEFKKLNEKSNFNLIIQSKSDQILVLLDIYCPNKNGSLTVLLKLENSVIIKENESLRVNMECVSKNVGLTKELVIFKFEMFVLGHWLDIKVTNNLSHINHRYVKPVSSYTHRNEEDYIKGNKLKASTRFIKVQIPRFNIPEKFLKVVLDMSNLENNLFYTHLRTLRPSLFKDMSFLNYEDRFHSLLYLEEITSLKAMSMYNQSAYFIKNGEYLMLEIENLSEKKPSVVIGDRVMATNADNSCSLTYEGYVHKVGAKHIYIKFKEEFHSSYDGENYNIEVISNRSSIIRMHYGVKMAIKILGKDILFPTRVSEREPQVDVNFNENLPATKELDNNPKIDNNGSDIQPKILSPKDTLRKLLEYKNSKLLLKESVSESSTGAESSSSNNIKFEWYNPKLNKYQREAVASILKGITRPLPYIIFGPPGTGKTVTLVETILQILRLIPHSRILVAAPSNSACDLLALKLIDSGVLTPGDLIRIVSFNHISSNLIPVKLIPYCASGSVAAEGTNINEIKVTESGLALDCTFAVLGRHRITVSTCSSAALLHQMGFSKKHFSHVLIDEASQASEPEVMIPLSLVDVDSGQIVLAGDPLQLGPTVLSLHAVELGLSESYQERLINRFPYSCDLQGFPETSGYDPRLVTKLLYNYRSVPVVLKLYSSLFYGDSLIPTISPHVGKESEFLKKLEELFPCKNGIIPSVIFHGVEGENYQTPDSPSWFNPQEASQVFYYVNEFYRLGLSKDEIGIISPYVKQVKEIRSILTEAEFDVPRVGSVEEFQGQEFQVVILSVVRSNTDYLDGDCRHNLGFISNPRRLNVSISRAKVLLIIIGNPNLLGKDVHWRYILNYCLELGSYKGCELRL